MGVANLWKTLDKGGAVTRLDGSKPGHHALILSELENTAVAVDLSAWLVQATTQPALVGNYESPYACVVKVVFDRTIHWLRHGVLPVFVIEGRTPPEKLERLRQRAAAAAGGGGGGAARFAVTGNRAGGQFDRLGQVARQVAEAMGVPCVQAVGEAEATCAALNVAGWVSGCHTADVDALLFGAQTVYRQLHLQVDDARKSQLSLCRLAAVQQLLGLSSGGHQALLAVAQLAGGDYDVAGAERVGDSMAVAAVKTLLQGQQDDQQLLSALQSALAAGSDPALEALTSCTGCRTCGHEGGRKTKVKAHTAANPCQQCLELHGELPAGAWCWPAAAAAAAGGVLTACSCRFHAAADQRQLNRVVGRAARTPGFMNSCRTALAAYQQQTAAALAAVQQEYGLAVPGVPNVFTWRARPNVQAVAALMCRYISDWDYRLVRVKLLPLLLEWDARQGPAAAGCQLQPVGIKKAVASPGAAGAGAAGSWCYLVMVDRLAGCPPVEAAAAAPGNSSGYRSSPSQAAAWEPGGSQGGSAGGAVAGRWRNPLVLPPGTSSELEDLAIDCAWLAGQGKGWLATCDAALSSSPTIAAAAAAAAGVGDAGARVARGPSQPSQASEPAGSQSGAGLGGEGEGEEGEGRGTRLLTGTCKPEHRYLRCSLVEEVWPQLVAAWRNKEVSKGVPGGARRLAAASTEFTTDATTQAVAAGQASQVQGRGPCQLQQQAQQQQQQSTLKDYFAAVKGRKPKLPCKAAAAAAAAFPELQATPSSCLVVAAASVGAAVVPPPAAAAGSRGRGRVAGNNLPSSSEVDLCSISGGNSSNSNSSGGGVGGRLGRGTQARSSSASGGRGRGRGRRTPAAAGGKQLVTLERFLSSNSNPAAAGGAGVAGSSSKPAAAAAAQVDGAASGSGGGLGAWAQQQQRAAHAALPLVVEGGPQGQHRHAAGGCGTGATGLGTLHPNTSAGPSWLKQPAWMGEHLAALQEGDSDSPSTASSPQHTPPPPQLHARLRANAQHAAQQQQQQQQQQAGVQRTAVAGAPGRGSATVLEGQAAGAGRGEAAGAAAAVVDTTSLLTGLQQAAATAAAQLGVAPGAAAVAAAGRQGRRGARTAAGGGQQEVLGSLAVAGGQLPRQRAGAAAAGAVGPEVHLVDSSSDSEEVAPLLARLQHHHQQLYLQTQQQQQQQQAGRLQPDQAHNPRHSSADEPGALNCKPRPTQQQSLAAAAVAEAAAEPELEGSPAKRGRLTGPTGQQQERPGRAAAAAGGVASCQLHSEYAALLADVSPSPAAAAAGHDQGPYQQQQQLAEQPRVRKLFRDSHLAPTAPAGPAGQQPPTAAAMAEGWQDLTGSQELVIIDLT